jgi:hypothetical protein
LWRKRLCRVLAAGGSGCAVSAGLGQLWPLWHANTRTVTCGERGTRTRGRRGRGGGGRKGGAPGGRAAGGEAEPGLFASRHDCQLEGQSNKVVLLVSAAPKFKGSSLPLSMGARSAPAGYEVNSRFSVNPSISVAALCTWPCPTPTCRLMHRYRTG